MLRTLGVMAFLLAFCDGIFYHQLLIRTFIAKGGFKDG